MRADRLVSGEDEVSVLLPNSPTLPSKPVFTWEQVAGQLTRDGNSWSSAYGQTTTVTYGFRATAPATLPDGTKTFSRFNEAQIKAAEEALKAWADVANIKFVRVGEGSTGESAFTNDATILFSNYEPTDPNSGTAAFAYLPSPGATAASNLSGDVFVDITDSYNATPITGDYGPHVLLHEIGHALGLEHPGNYDGGSPSYFANAVYWQDSRAFTVMSYFSSSNTGANLGAYAYAPLLHDIAALQRLYGANTQTRVGDTIYGFNSNTDRSWYSLVDRNSVSVFSIWDAGGTDTLDLSGYQTASDIDLRPESFSSAGPGSNGAAKFNISIGRGVIIENAIGGSGDDTLTGNSVDNTLRGLGGADKIYGGDGSDTLFGGAGNDTLFGEAGNDSLFGEDGDDNLYAGLGNDSLFGGIGNDTYYIESASVTISEQENAGQDKVVTKVSFDLPVNFEEISAEANGIRVTGNAGNNILSAAAGNVSLFGLAGDDIFRTFGRILHMDGGSGNDTAEFQYGISVIVNLYSYGGTTGITVTDVANYGDYDEMRRPNNGIDLVDIENLKFSFAQNMFGAIRFENTKLSPILSGNTTSISSTDLPAFDPYLYLATNTNLIKAYYSDPVGAFKHYISTGFQNGLPILGFKADQYIASYGDLISAYGLNTQAATVHYVEHGFDEGRRPNLFDSWQYLASYTDLILGFGSSTTSATRHYIEAGYKEGRASDAFDGLRYVAGYADLIRAFGLNETAAAKHYVEYGFKEGRNLSAFNALEYTAGYKDLIKAFGTDQANATRHFIESGFQEGRKANAFNTLEYIASNADLIRAFGANTTSGAKHYIDFGISEGRTIDDFNATQYLLNYGDLRVAFGNDLVAATKHYILHGFYEGRTDDTGI